MVFGLQKTKDYDRREKTTSNKITKTGVGNC